MEGRVKRGFMDYARQFGLSWKEGVYGRVYGRQSQKVSFFKFMEGRVKRGGGMAQYPP